MFSLADSNFYFLSFFMNTGPGGLKPWSVSTHSGMLVRASCHRRRRQRPDRWSMSRQTPDREEMYQNQLLSIIVLMYEQSLR